jgi:hypothetical protein
LKRQKVLASFGHPPTDFHSEIFAKLGRHHSVAATEQDHEERNPAQRFHRLHSTGCDRSSMNRQCCLFAGDIQVRVLVAARICNGKGYAKAIRTRSLVLPKLVR